MFCIAEENRPRDTVATSSFIKKSGSVP